MSLSRMTSFSTRAAMRSTTPWAARHPDEMAMAAARRIPRMAQSRIKIGRASCRERVFMTWEDGIRDDLVTGVQTCALPILGIVFRLAVEELLVAAERTDVAQQDDLVLDASRDAIHDSLGRQASRRNGHGSRKENPANGKITH